MTTLRDTQRMAACQDMINANKNVAIFILWIELLSTSLIKPLPLQLLPLQKLKVEYPYYFAFHFSVLIHYIHSQEKGQSEKFEMEM